MATQLSTNATTVSTLPSFYAMREWQVRIWRHLSLWKRRSRDRAALRSLGPLAIHDFCPRQTEAEMEMNKPFWRE